MMVTGIKLAICSLVVHAIRSKAYDNAMSMVIDAIIATLVLVAVHFIAEICYHSLITSTRRHLQSGSTTVKRGLAATVAAAFTRGGGPRLKVTMAGSQMTTTVMVPRSHTLTQTLQMDFPSDGVQEPRVKVTMKLPNGAQMTVMQPRSQPFMQTFSRSG